ncbi:TniB family NTP-binding protein [Dyella acidisoli]|uniref:Transposition protein TniB n=1 Tax=Dyella acidisoli TaxID=1867834 RepID=A0ABQ5XLB6_9GAMM|nr:TniB family NTP-binding protein [Dyella acidisoli]GLQ91989.1 transposition protein TniB [Dyella acidisoli]
MDSRINEEHISTPVNSPLPDIPLNTTSTDDDVLYAHLNPTLRADAALPAAVRMELIKHGGVIEHKAYRTAMDYAHWLLTQPLGVAPMGMLVTGEPGAGKSTVGNELVRIGQGRVLMFQAGGARNMRDIYGRIIEALEGLVSKNARTSDRQHTVFRLFRAMNIRGLVADEIQDVKDGTQREHQQVLTSLKMIMNEAKVALICLGTPESDQALRIDKHLKARLRPFRLPQWQANQDLVDLLGVLETSLPLRRPSELRNEQVLNYLAEVSEGSLREIMSRIKCAGVRAILSGEERLDLAGLKAAEDPPPRPQGLESLR